MKTAFDKKRTGTGTKEWAEMNVNIQIGCANGCIYCFAADRAAKMYGGWCEREDWTNERLTKRAEMKSYPASDGVIMFPSTHDITPFNVQAYIRVAKLMLDKGNSLLIVTKPNILCIQELCTQLDKYREQILFRFTITTMDRNLSKFWEPGAPLPHERLDSLGHAWTHNFRTSISIEPMLAGVYDAMKTVKTVDSLVTDTIWIGKMNKARLRVDMSIKENRIAVEEIDRLQCDEEILRLYQNLKHNPKVQWKDSIRQVLERPKGCEKWKAPELRENKTAKGEKE